MATNTKLAPLRAYSEYDVFNMSAYSGSIPVTAGTVVKHGASGWRSDEADTALLGSVGASYGNTVSQRYGTLPFVQDAGTGDAVVGMLLYDVREVDENGEKLIYNPRKAAENNWILSGQTVPIVSQGLFLISGTINGTVTPGAILYPSGAGALTTNSINQITAGQVGKVMGSTSANGYTLIRLNVS